MPTSKQKVPELPSELRRAAKISTSGYWAGVLLEAADEIEAARRQDETFARQPSDCKHEHADIRCSDCGIDFRRVSHSDSFAPLLAAANEVLANFMPSFGGSREVDDCLVQLAAAVADAEKARPSEKASVRCTCFEDKHSQDCEENGCCGQCTGAAQNGTGAP